jgi:hypothetical protein
MKDVVRIGMDTSKNVPSYRGRSPEAVIMRGN